MMVKRKHLLTLAAVSLVALSLVGTRGRAEEPEKVDVFVNGDGYPRYRIPSLICTPKGTLLAFCEGRVGNDQSPTDMVLKRSLDGGKTCLTIMPDGMIGCLFETAGCSKTAFTKFSLEWLTDGKDSLKR